MIKQLLFIIIFLLICIVTPIFLFILYPLIRLITDTDLFMINSNIYIKKLLRVNTEIIDEEKKIKEGFILPNHRSWFDFSYDVYISDSLIVGRKEAFIAVLLNGLISVMTRRAIIFTRGKINRHQLYHKIINHLNSNKIKRVIIYPEGTRLKYTSINNLDEVKTKLKVGFLKTIYEKKKHPVQLLISNNKEKVFNEKKISANLNVNVKTIYSDPIHPKNFNNFDEFYNKVCQEWLRCWNIVYN